MLGGHSRSQSTQQETRSLAHLHGYGQSVYARHSAPASGRPGAPSAHLLEHKREERDQVREIEETRQRMHEMQMNSGPGLTQAAIDEASRGYRPQDFPAEEHHTGSGSSTSEHSWQHHLDEILSDLELKFGYAPMLQPTAQVDCLIPLFHCEVDPINKMLALMAAMKYELDLLSEYSASKKDEHDEKVWEWKMEMADRLRVEVGPAVAAVMGGVQKAWSSM